MDDAPEVIGIRGNEYGVLVFDSDKWESIPQLLGILSSENNFDVEWTRLYWAGPYEVIAVISGAVSAATGFGTMLISWLTYRQQPDNIQINITVNDNRVLSLGHDLNEQDHELIAKFFESYNGSIQEAAKHLPSGRIVTNKAQEAGDANQAPPGSAP